MAKLYKFDLSPPARTAMMTCDIFNAPVQMVDIDLVKQEHLTPEYLQINPAHTVPALVDGDLLLQDSHAIITYLADVYGKDDTWYPKDPRKRALVNQKLFFEATVIFPRLRNVTYYFFLHGQKKVSAQKVEDIEEVYKYLETFLSKTKFLALDHMTLADVAALPTVSGLGYIIKLDDKKYPKTHAWLKEMDKQPFWKKYGEAAKVFKILETELEFEK